MVGCLLERHLLEMDAASTAIVESRQHSASGSFDEHGNSAEPSTRKYGAEDEITLPFLCEGTTVL